MTSRCCICSINTSAGPARACTICHRTWHRDCSLPENRTLDCPCTTFIALHNGTPSHCIAKGCKKPTTHWFCIHCTETLPERLEQFVFAQKRVWYPSPHHLILAFLQSTSTILDITKKDPENALRQAAQRELLKVLDTIAWHQQRAHVFMMALETLKKTGQFKLPLQSEETGVPVPLLGKFKQWLRSLGVNDKRESIVFVGTSAIHYTAPGQQHITSKESLARALDTQGLSLYTLYGSYPNAIRDIASLEREKACWIDGSRTHIFAMQPQKIQGLKETLEAVPAHMTVSEL